MKKYFFYLLLIFCSARSHGQQVSQINISFTPVFGKIPLVLENYNYLANTVDSIKFEVLKFYISGIQLLNDNNIAYSETNSFHLIDVFDKNSISCSLTIPSAISYNEIKFNLGIDSITNSSGVMGGDLDPTKGMYWTWQSGYINFKMEGIGSACTTRNHGFQFHIGGYQAPFNTLQTIRLKVNKEDLLQIFIDIKRFFETVDLVSHNHIMSPNKEALNFSVLLAKCFRTK